jgi:hypothetical protein
VLKHSSIEASLAELSLPRAAAAAAMPASSNGDLSVLVLIGMRGCGKTANGIAAAKALNRAFIDLDDVFEEEVSEHVPVPPALLRSLLPLPPPPPPLRDLSLDLPRDCVAAGGRVYQRVR